MDLAKTAALKLNEKKQQNTIAFLADKLARKELKKIEEEIGRRQQNDGPHGFSRWRYGRLGRHTAVHLPPHQDAKE